MDYAEPQLVNYATTLEAPLSLSVGVQVAGGRRGARKLIHVSRRAAKEIDA